MFDCDRDRQRHEMDKKLDTIIELLEVTTRSDGYKEAWGQLRIFCQGLGDVADALDEMDKIEAEMKSS